MFYFGTVPVVTMHSDYWCDRRLVITVEGPDRRQRFEVDKPYARLGSHALSEVLIPDKGISRRRLYFHATDDGVFCADLSHLKSATANLSGWLAPDDILELGPYRISAQLANPPSSEVHPPTETLADLETKGSAAEPRPVLVMSVKGKELARRELTRQLTVLGRRSPSKLRINSHSVSATHCVFYWDGGGLWVVDLFSGNGTRRQGQSIDVARFSPGDSLAVGPAELHHLAASKVERISHENKPDEVSYSAGHDSHVGDDGGDGRGSEIEIADSSPQMVESLALAARLAAQREEFEAEMADWTNRRRQADDELAERAQRLSADRAELDGRKAQWDETRRREDEQLAARRHELDEAAAAIENEKQELATLRGQTEEERRQTEAATAGQTGQRKSIDELQAQIEDRRRELKEETDAWLAEQNQRQAEHRRNVEELSKKQEAFLVQQEAAAEAEAKLSEDRQDLERQVSELAAARDELRQEKEVWQSECRQEENSLGERTRQLEEASKLLTADRDEFDGLCKNREEELRREDERLAELSRQLAERETDLQDRQEAWETKRQQDEDSLGDRSAQLEEAAAALSNDRERHETACKAYEEEYRRLDDDRAGLSQELAAKRANIERDREAWEAERQQDKDALDAGQKEFEEAAAALAGERREFEAARETWEEERRRLEAEHAEFLQRREELESRRRHQDGQSQEQSATTGPKETPLPGPDGPIDSSASGRPSQLQHESAPPGPTEPSPDIDPCLSSTLANHDGSPRLDALTTIRRGPRWTPPRRNYGPRRALGCSWILVLIAAIACSGITAAAIWFSQMPSCEVTIETSDTVSDILAAMTPEQFINSRKVLEAASDRVVADIPTGFTRRNDPTAWLFRRIMVDYSEDTRCLWIGLRGSNITESRKSVDAIGDTILAEMTVMEDGDESGSPPSKIVARPNVESNHRLPLTLGGMALGFFAPIILVIGRGRRWAAAPARPRYGSA